MFPSIVDEQERLNYKLEFDQDHQEYKGLQAELDGINQDIADLESELGRHTEGSPQFLVSAAVPIWVLALWSKDSQFTPLQGTCLKFMAMITKRIMVR